jgi:hypothetical protein
MRKLIFLAMIYLVVGCKKSSDTGSLTNNSIFGKWKLTEYYTDPGGGGATWQAADPNNLSTIEFRLDGTLNITPSSVYNSDHFKVLSDSTLIFIRGTDSLPYRYQFSKALLSLYPPCIEGCGDRSVPYF